MGFIKILKADLNAQSKNGKKIIYEKIEKWPLFCYFLAIFSLKLIFITDCILENVSNFDMMVAPTMVISVPSRVFGICSV